MRQATESRRTVDDGIKRTLSRIISLPRLTFSFMEPTPIALMVEPLTPLTVRFEIGRSVAKSLRSGEMWVVQPLSRRKGEVEVDGSLKREVDVIGETEIFAESMGRVLEAQSTEATNSS